jgi:hypothetical protein
MPRQGILSALTAAGKFGRGRIAPAPQDAQVI